MTDFAAFKNGKGGYMAGDIMFYGGIALAALGCLLLVMQVARMKNQKELAKEAAKITDVAPIAVASSGKASKGSASKQPSTPAFIGYERTIRLKDGQLNVDDRTVKLSSMKDAMESEIKPGSINRDNENVDNED